MQTVPYSADFFGLQLRFAEKAAAVTGKPWAEAVGLYTNLYVRLGMGRRLDAGNPEWQACLAEGVTASDRAEWAHRLHRSRLHLPAGPAPTEAVGCFSYELQERSRARLHFDPGEHESPLSLGHRVRRRDELAELFRRLKAFCDDEPTVIGASWLYHLDAYRRLFPDAYVARLEAIEPPWQRMPLWGQFLQRDRTVRRDWADRFRARVAEASNLAELGRCFPFQVLATTSPAGRFYEHFGV